jgi:large subunit ribosomal protein L13
MSVQRTYHPKAGEVERQWYLIDASGENLGRLASRIAATLLGKHKPQFTPGFETGDYVIVVNAEKVAVSQRHLDQKVYYRHSGYPGGLKKIGLRDQLAKFPERVIQLAVRGMLPKNRYGRRLIGNLKVYAGPEHPHQAQQPKPLA